MIVAGVMSGTSADGIDVALMRITGSGNSLRFKLLGHRHTPYAGSVRELVLTMMDAKSARVSQLARLNVLLGELYSSAILGTAKRFAAARVDLVGCHGQTLYHQGDRADFLGRKISCTWQTGEGAIVAARVGCPVVSDFRHADMAAGGKGAPLVPFLDYALYRHRTRGRILQNLGGISNVTAVPAGAIADNVIAFDTGPANMVIDECMERLFSEPYDRNGAIAAQGDVLERPLAKVLGHPFFKRRPPKSAGREEFGRSFVDRFLTSCAGANPQDVIATATALTARSIGAALRRFVLRESGRYRDYVVAGGGARNRTLMRMLQQEIAPLGLTLALSDGFGVPAQAKEAIAFAVLAYETWHQRAANMPSATGASRPVILGKISLPPPHV